MGKEKKDPEKWAVLVLGVLVMIGGLVVFGLLRYSAGNIEEKLRDTMHQSVVQRKNNVDYRLRTLRTNAQNLIGIVYPYMGSSAGDINGHMEEYGELKSIIGIYENSDGVTKVRLYVPDVKIYSSQRQTFFPMTDLAEQSEGMEDGDLPYLEDSGVFWQEQGVIPGYTDGITALVQVISCVYSIRDRNNFDKIACVLFMDMDVNELEGALSMDADSEMQVSLVNEKGASLTPFGGLEIGETAVGGDLMDRIRGENSGEFKIGKTLYVFEKLEETGWYVVMTSPLGSIYQLWSVGGRSFFLLVLSVIAAFALFCLLLVYNITMSAALKRMNSSLKKLYPEAEEMNFNSIKTLDNAYRMEKCVDQMVQTVNELTEKRYRDQIAIAEYEMKSLQEQIKPHFLYNTLDMIKWMIMDGKSEDGIWMVNALSKYLRQSINKGPGIITISEELELSRTYLMIMMKRFPNRFEAEYEIEEETENCCIPKFSLQPLLENALLHGILYCKKEEKRLTIRAWKEERRVWIEVEDNGNGMTQEKLCELQTGGGYGLSNVRKRLEIFGKGEAEFNVSSKEGVGTCITICIPQVYESGRDENSKEQHR